MQIVETVKTTAKEIFSPRTLLTTVAPMTVGFALPQLYREPLLRRLPSGFLARLGRFGMAVGDGLIAVGEGVFSRLVLPENYRVYGYMAAYASAAVALFDLIKALSPTPRMAEPVTPRQEVVVTPPAPVVTSTPKPAEETVPKTGYY
jgi:hypothetical protein